MTKVKIEQVFNPGKLKKFLLEHPDEVFTSTELKQALTSVPGRWLSHSVEIRNYLGDGWWLKHPTAKSYYYGVPEAIIKLRELLGIDE